MKLLYRLKYLFLFFTLAGLNLNLNGQEKPNTKTPEQPASKTTVTEEIEVVRSYKPVLADAVKIRRSPNLSDNKPFNPRVKYNILDKRLELNSAIRELEAQKLIQLKESELNNNYAKLGAGNLGTSIAQLHLGTNRDEALQAGFNFNHWAMSGKLNQQKMSEQEAGVYGRSIGDNIILNGKLNYNRRTNYLYGIDPEGSFNNPNPNRQRFTFIEADGDLYNRIDPFDTDKLAFAAKVSGYLFNNLYEGKENAIIVSGGLSKNFSKFQLGVNSLVDFTTTRDLAYTLNNHIFGLNPFIKIDGEQLQLTAGINYIKEFGSKNRTNIFPVASMEFVIIKNYLSVYGLLEGNVQKMRLKDLSYINPFINENLFTTEFGGLNNQVEKFKLVGGVKGTLAANIGFNASVNYKTVGDFYYFVNNIDNKERFNIEYIPENSNILGFTGELNIQFSEVVRIDSRLELNQFNLRNELNAWFYPAAKLNSTGSFKLSDKIRLNADLYLQGETKAKVYNSTSTSTPPDFTIKTLKAFIDLGAGAEYQYNKKIGAFLRVNNLLGQDYQRYLYYPNYGLNILGGFSYGF